MLELLLFELMSQFRLPIFMGSSWVALLLKFLRRERAGGPAEMRRDANLYRRGCC
jgi:hypothetical protein